MNKMEEQWKEQWETQWKEIRLDNFHTYLKAKYDWKIKLYEEIIREKIEEILEQKH